ncbi:hypothetical protein [Jiangella alba]|nr:hypothetical protein [Jiangella alba]
MSRRLISGLVGIAALAAGVTTSAGAAGATGTADDAATTKAAITASCVKSNAYITDPWQSTYRLIYCDNVSGVFLFHPSGKNEVVGRLYSTRSWFGCKKYMGAVKGWGYYTWGDVALGGGPQNGWGLMPSGAMRSGNPHIVPTCANG